MNFSNEITSFFNTEYDIENPITYLNELSKDKLLELKNEIINKREEYNMLEHTMKTLGNAAYGATANPFFYLYNVNISADITGECRDTIQYIEKQLNELFHETLWTDTTLQKKLDFKLDKSKHNWYRLQPVTVAGDTDSLYTNYGSFIKCWDSTTKDKYNDKEKITKWILNFNTNFLDIQNNKWLEDKFAARHVKSIHNFELETISHYTIFLKKKKYIKSLIYNKGKYIDNEKVAGCGIEIVKSTTPKFCRKALSELIGYLLANYESSDNFNIGFNKMVKKVRDDFFKEDYDNISMSIGVGDYEKYVIDDTNVLKLKKAPPTSVQAVALFNFLAYKNNESEKSIYSGKVKYYKVRRGKEFMVFGYPIGELPSWAPNMDHKEQFQKTILDPLNRFCLVIGLPEVNLQCAPQLTLF